MVLQPEAKSSREGAKEERKIRKKIDGLKTGPNHPHLPIILFLIFLSSFAPSREIFAFY